MSLKSPFAVIFILFFYFNCYSFVSINENWTEKVSSDLIKQFEKNNNVDIIVFLNSQYRQKPLNENLSKQEKATRVYRNLKENNIKNQSDITVLLNRFGYKYKQLYTNWCFN